jgi:glycosyltransferase involved in cell wall biosynthesis
LRLLFLSASVQLGGAEASLLDMLASLRHAEPGWSLHLLAPASGPLLARASALGVTAAPLPLPAALARLGEAGVTAGRVHVLRAAASLVPAVAALGPYVRDVRAAIAAIQPDLVHTNGPKMHLVGARAVGRPGPALVWHLHDYLGSRPLTGFLLRSHRARCRAVIANSESVAADVRASLGDGVPVVVVANAIDVDRFSPTGDRLDLDALAGLPPAPPGTVRVGLLATFARWKGQEVFLDAVSRLAPDVPVRGYIIGGGLYQTEGSQYSLDELRAAASKFGVSGRVGFTGFVERPETALRALDIAVHASTAPEPFGLAIVEAMACGRAVVAAAAGGAAEIVAPGVDGLMHPPGDAGRLAARIAELAGDAALRQRLGATARATAVRRFNRARLASDLIPIYCAACH